MHITGVLTLQIWQIMPSWNGKRSARRHYILYTGAGYRLRSSNVSYASFVSDTSCTAMATVWRGSTYGGYTFCPYNVSLKIIYGYYYSM